jgi:uncharacterized protein YkwD
MALVADRPETKRVRRSKGLAALAGAIFLVVLLASTPLGPLVLTGGRQLASEIEDRILNGGNAGALNYTVYSPLIMSGEANVSYPADYSTFAEYAIGQINSDRASYGLAPVSLSPNPAGQQHANSMLKFEYFSHFDTQGFKPYMRYTLLGGTGAVEENVATENHASFRSVDSVESAIKGLEHDMMYNDVACCNNGHRDNILTALHNRVSIGISFNGTSLYFVEDFENFYSNLSVSVSSSYEVTMSGGPLTGVPTPKSVLIAYDLPPATLSKEQLNSGPHSYTPGTVQGGVLPPCTLPLGGCARFVNGTTVYADSWTFNQRETLLSFSLHSFIAANGAGVYTVYLLTGPDTTTAVTSFSVFIDQP